MSPWSELSVLDKVQLAIMLEHRYPEVGARLGVEVGGTGTASHTSLSQYLARQLPCRIKNDGDTFPVEGAFLSNEYVASLNFVRPGGGQVTRSLTDSGYDLWMFRIRAA